MDLDLFYGKVKFGPLGFWMEKSWEKKVEKVHYLAAVVLFGTTMHSVSTQMKF